MCRTLLVLLCSHSRSQGSVKRSRPHTAFLVTSPFFWENATRDLQGRQPQTRTQRQGAHKKGDTTEEEGAEEQQSSVQLFPARVFVSAPLMPWGRRPCEGIHSHRTHRSPARESLPGYTDKRSGISPEEWPAPEWTPEVNRAGLSMLLGSRSQGTRHTLPHLAKYESCLGVTPRIYRLMSIRPAPESLQRGKQGLLLTSKWRSSRPVEGKTRVLLPRRRKGRATVEHTLHDLGESTGNFMRTRPHRGGTRLNFTTRKRPTSTSLLDHVPQGVSLCLRTAVGEAFWM